MEEKLVKCSECNLELPETEFYTSFIKKTSKMYRQKFCKSCSKIKSKPYKDKYTAINRERYKERRKTDKEYGDRVRRLKRENTRKNMTSTMLSNCKNRAKRKGIEFNLTIEDMTIPEVCPLLEVPFVLGQGKDYLYTPTTDRIDSTKGYIKGNVRVISMLANSMKNCATTDQLRTFTKNIEKYLRYSPSYREEESIELGDKEPLG